MDMKKVISMMVILCTMLLVCVNPVSASRHRHKTFALHLQRKQMLKSIFVAPYEVSGDGNKLTFHSTTGVASEVQIQITDLSGKEITSVTVTLTDAPFTIDLPEDCPECIIRLYDKGDIYEATY